MYYLIKYGHNRTTSDVIEKILFILSSHCMKSNLHFIAEAMLISHAKKNMFEK